MAGTREAAGAFRLLLSANPLPMWVYDLETLRFLEVNDAAVALYGYSRAQFLAMGIRDIRPAEDRAHLQAIVDEATGLANAALFTDRVAAALGRSRSEGGQVGILVVGLGALEEVASTVGDDAAGAMAKATAERLRASSGAKATLARLGGGRFAALCEARDELAILALASTVSSAFFSPWR